MPRTWILPIMLVLTLTSSCRLLRGHTDGATPDASAQCLDQTFPSGGAGSGGGIIGNTINAVDGSVVGGVTVTIIPQSALKKSFSVTTDASGNYTTGPIERASYTVQFSLPGYISCTVPVSTGGSNVTANCALSPVLNDNQFRMVLTWTGPIPGGIPDIDSYLTVPGDGLPVYYGRRNGTGASLDQDRTNWSGPETITITAEQPGTTVYYFNNYSVRGDLSALYNSSPVVTLYQGSHCVKKYVIRPGAGLTYEVFHLTNGVVSDVEAYNDTLTTF